MGRGRKLSVLVVTAALIFGGCGTPLYEITDEEENLIVQGAAYMLSKHNIYQKDGMNGTRIEEESEKPEDTGNQDDTQSEEPGASLIGSGGKPGNVSEGGKVSLAGSVGLEGRLDVSYKGYSLMDVYWGEGRYTYLGADEGKTLLVMDFTLSNPGDEKCKVDNFGKGYEFYISFQGADHIAEKKSIYVESLSAYVGEIPAKQSADAVLIFEIGKEAAEQIKDLKLTMEHEKKAYSVSL